MKIAIPRDILIIFLKTKYKDKILKATTEKRNTVNKGKKITNMAEFLIGNNVNEETIDQFI